MVTSANLAETNFSRRELRQMLEVIFPEITDLNAFIADFFNDTYRQFGSATPRTDRINILLERNEPSDIASQLNRLWPEPVKKFRASQFAEGQSANSIISLNIRFSNTVEYRIRPRNLNFVGRSKAVRQINEMLVKYRHVALSGMGGIGKTELATEYLHEYRDSYGAIFWIKADQRRQIIDDYLEITEKLKKTSRPVELLREKPDPNYVCEQLIDWLNSSEGWLCIYDNMDFANDEQPAELRKLLPLLSRGHILVTTRNPDSTGLGFKLLELSTFTEEEALSFLGERTAQGSLSASDRQAQMDFAREADYFPLALEQAAAWVRRAHSWSDYLANYRREPIATLQRRQPDTDYPLSVKTTWTISYKYISEKYPKAAHILDVCAFLYADDIPEFLFIEAATELGIQWSPETNAATELDSLLERLFNYALIRRDTGRFRIHRLVHAVLQFQMNQHLDGKREQIERVVRAFATIFPLPKQENWERCRALLDHVRVSARLIAELQLLSTEAGQLMNHLALYLNTVGHYREAQDAFQRALHIREALPSPSQVDIAITLNNLAALHDDLHEYEDAERLYERALKIKQQLLEPAHISIATTLNNLAVLYRNTNRYEKARKYCQKALTIRENKFEANHPLIAESLSNLGDINYRQKRYAAAEQLFQRALQIRKKLTRPNSLAIASSVIGLGNVYTARRAYKKAGASYDKALSLQQQALGETHPVVASTLVSRARLHSQRGSVDDARRDYRRALEILEPVLGGRDPWLRNIASELQALPDGQGDKS